MLRLLGAVLLGLALLSGCGEASSSTVADGSPTPSPSKSSTAPGAYQTVAIVSQTAAGGKVDGNAVRLDDSAARAAFLAQFRQASMTEKVDRAVASATVPSGYVLVAAVVAVGCDVPPGVDVTLSPDGYVLTAQQVDKPLQECLAPVTSVAIVAVPA